MRRDKTDTGRRSALLIAAMVVLTGCSITPRPTFIEIVPEKAAASASDTRERAVYIRAVNDLRKFTLNASPPQVPSLSSVTALDPKQTATAVAQIRTAGGTVFADVFLKDGKTAAALIKDATTDGSRVRAIASWSRPAHRPISLSTSISSSSGRTTPGRGHSSSRPSSRRRSAPTCRLSPPTTTSAAR